MDSENVSRHTMQLYSIKQNKIIKLAGTWNWKIFQVRYARLRQILHVFSHSDPKNYVGVSMVRDQTLERAHEHREDGLREGGWW